MSNTRPLFVKFDGCHDIIIMFNYDDGLYYLTDSRDYYIFSSGFKNLDDASLTAHQYHYRYDFKRWSYD